jgi:enoyl-CoA hydratase
VDEAIILEQFSKTLIIRFNRPEIRSPLSVFVLDRLHALLDRAAAENLNVIFTGTGDVFASGADLREIGALTGEKALEFALYGQSLMQKIEGVNALAAVNGFCFGGALDLALACRQRIAAPEAQFSHPGANLGIMTGWGGTQRLPRLIGQGAALEMFYTAKRVSADEALKIGLIDRISINPLETALELLAE